MDEMDSKTNKKNQGSFAGSRMAGLATRFIVSIGLTVVCLGAVLLLTNGTSYPGVAQAPPDGGNHVAQPKDKPKHPDFTDRRTAPVQPDNPVRLEDYSWLKQLDTANLLSNRIAPPAGYARVQSSPGSFAFWLQNLPLKPGQPKVMLYNGKLKVNQGAHVAVIDMDTGSRDLQQCADSIMRLRAEYLFAKGDGGAIQFNFTSGATALWSRWSAGERPTVQGTKVTWRKAAAPDKSYAGLRKYLDTVFNYAGTISLSRELQPVRFRDMQIGDVLIAPGSPGHAIIVVDQALNAQGRKVFLLAQGFMPAQEMHILKNPNAQLSPWYDGEAAGRIVTPEWTFGQENLKRFKGQQ